MNRHERRARNARGPLAPGKRFVAKCLMCEADACVLHTMRRAVDPKGPKDVGICEGCPCAVGKCEWCGETGKHWLGCAAVGLPSTGGKPAN